MFEILLAGVTAGGFSGLFAHVFQLFGQVSEVLLLGLLTGDQVLDLTAQFVQTFFGSGVLTAQTWRRAQGDQE